MTAGEHIVETKSRPKPIVFVFFGVAVAFMAVVVWLSIKSVRGEISSPEQYANNIATLLPFGYAFAAGMVASVNPCGFFILPTFAAYYVGGDVEGAAPGSAPSTPMGLTRGVLAGLSATAGFVVLFSAIGLVIDAGGRAITTVFPWAGFTIGIVLTLLGLWLLVTGRTFGLMFANKVQAPIGRSLPSFFLFGIAYGTSSLASPLPVFLVVVGTSLANKGIISAMTQFVSYGLGMGVILIIIAVAASTLKTAFVNSLRGLLPYVHRLSALFLLGAGAYMIFYWVVLGEIFK